jgi:protein required for attachment to host cells
MKSKTWIAVANASCARIFTVGSGNVLTEVQSLIHPQARLHGKDFDTDKPGRAFESAGSGSHAMEKSNSSKQREAEIFAKEIAAELSKFSQNGEFDRGFLAAGPAQLGLIRAHLDAATISKLEAEVAKDITHLTPEQIREHFPFGY